MAFSSARHAIALTAALLSGVLAVRRQKKSSSGDCYSPYDGKQLLGLKTITTAEREDITTRLTHLSCADLSEDTADDFEAICDDEGAAVLLKEYGAKVVAQDAGAFYRGQSGVAKTFVGSAGTSTMTDFFADWRDTDARLARVAAAVAASQGVATYTQIGTSVENEPIMAVRLRGSGWQSDSGMPRVIAAFQNHAREWIAGMAGVYAVENAIQKAIADPSWLAGMELVLVPAANPDGIRWSETSERMFRKNRRVNAGSSCRGVDLNRQYPPGWGGGFSTSTNPCSDVFYGAGPLSEPEAVAIANLTDESGGTTLHLDVHSYTQILIVPYGYTSERHPRRDEMDVPGQAMQAAISGTHGVSYRYGGSEMLYPASGVARDYVASRGGFGWTVELRPASASQGGFAPPASEILPTAEEFFNGLLAGIDWVQNPPAPTPAPPPGSWELSGSGCEMDGNCIQSLNHPSNYGNSEQCTISLAGEVALTVDAFNTESGYDFLTVGGTAHAGTAGPSAGTYSGVITWASDSSVVSTGWKLCRSN